MSLIGPNIELIDKLKEGGTANVYLGVDTWTGFPVAVKELKPNFFESEYVRDKFISEANQYLYLKHPNIVGLQNFIDAGTSQYLVMDYVDGYNLSDYTDQVTGPMPPTMAALFVIEVLNALAYAHAKKVIHLDIKPANIMLSNENEIKVLDFGIAHESGESNVDKIMGTPSYMSPEQVVGKDIDHRTDIYAVGITLYELITGKPPFADSNDRQELFWNIKNKNVPTIPGGGAINDIIQKATQKNKMKRYKDCEAFIHDLQKLI